MDAAENLLKLHSAFHIAFNMTYYFGQIFIILFAFLSYSYFAILCEQYDCNLINYKGLSVAEYCDLIYLKLV